MNTRIKPFHELTLADDFVFSEIMRKPENITVFLEDLLDKKIAKVEYIDKQKDLKDAYDAHGIRLDVYLEDEHHTKYDCEIQARLHPHLEKRIRYYESGIDRHSLEVGGDYGQLSDSYVIFICAEDYFHAGLAVYERESHIKGHPEISYEDGSHAFILNADYTVENASPATIRFLHYVRARLRGEEIDISDSAYLTKIDREIEEIKHNSGKELEYMTLAMKLQDERRIGREEGREEGRTLRDRELVFRLLSKGYSLEEISDITGIEVPFAKELAEQGESCFPCVD